MRPVSVFLFFIPFLYMCHTVDTFTRMTGYTNNWIKRHCGLPTTGGPRHRFKITHPPGQEAVPGQFPWSVFITVRNLKLTYVTPTGPHVTYGTGHCSGTLITTRHVLTAAHCLSNIETDYDDYGSQSQRRTGEITRIENIVITLGATHIGHGGQADPRGIQVGATEILPETREHVLSENDYTIIEMDRDIRALRGHFVPACFQSQEQIIHAPLTITTFDLTQLPNPLPLVFYNDFRHMPCHTEEARNPYIECFLPSIAEFGDAGAAITYNVRDQEGRMRAHIHAVLRGTTRVESGSYPSAAYGINIMKQEDPHVKSPFRVIQDELNLMTDL